MIGGTGVSGRTRRSSTSTASPSPTGTSNTANSSPSRQPIPYGRCDHQSAAIRTSSGLRPATNRSPVKLSGKMGQPALTYATAADRNRSTSALSTTVNAFTACAEAIRRTGRCQIGRLLNVENANRTAVVQDVRLHEGW